MLKLENICKTYNIGTVNESTLFTNFNLEVKKGEFISSHLHLNVTYVFECDMSVQLTVAEEENSEVGWIQIDELASKCDEPFMIPIYEKLIEKIGTTF